MLLAYLMKRLIRFGRLTIIDADGRRHAYGQPSQPGDFAHPIKDVAIRLHDKKLHTKLALTPRLSLGEAYMDGTLTVEDGASIYDFLSLVMVNMRHVGRRGALAPIIWGADRILRPLQQYNPISRSRENVAHHYDLSGQLYDLFLDRDRQYSCAYFQSLDDSLDMAQARKKQHIASKLLLQPGQKVLDIGSGWGGLGLYLAREAGVDVTGLTLSTEQHKVSNSRAEADDLQDRARFVLRDYRHETAKYNRIVSVGMFEHVGVNHYQAFFDKVADLLADDGVCLLHAIGRSDGPGTTNPWIRKYIFPGGYCPAVSEVLPVIERAGLVTTDIEILRLHYAETLKHWRMRFMPHWDLVKSELYDERFCRMWEFYLACCEAAFRYQDLMVFQIQIAKRIDAVPMTRDYMAEWKRQHPLPALQGEDAGMNIAAAD
ncbi:MAG TPA: cyclopropane-fatty-acyl-phospholipid synthase family protein [Stellaceae bacterium]|jgi:cyclopropane-fatty-acyl-phospholipid synthase|nr:cyclopropane-fatty-acyl-phospholipid synthase family protein [Stellaceae bacterium]